MATLKSVQSGTATIAAGAATGTATITAVTTANSIVDFSYQVATGAAHAADYGGVRATLTNTTTITFTRAASTSAPVVNIVWYVSEFTSGVAVQRGTVTQTSITMNVTLSPAITVAKSWVIANRSSVYINEAPWCSIHASITTTTNLAVVDTGYDAEVGDIITDWQVIQYDNCTTALYTTSKSTSGTTNQAVTAVTVAKCLVYFTGNIDGAESDVVDASLYYRAYLSSTTNIQITEPGTPGAANTIKTYTVDISDAVTVQRGDTAIASGNTTTNAALTTVVTANSMTHVTGENNTLGTSSYTTDGRTSRNAHSAQITTTTNLALVRAESGTAATLAWEEIEWAGTSGWAYASIMWIPEYVA